MPDEKLPESLLKAAQGLGPDIAFIKKGSPLDRVYEQLSLHTIVFCRAHGLTPEALAFVLYHMALNAMAVVGPEYMPRMDRLARECEQHFEIYKKLTEAQTDD